MRLLTTTFAFHHLKKILDSTRRNSTNETVFLLKKRVNAMSGFNRKKSNSVI